MTEAARQPKDKNYNLITVLYQSSDNVESLKTYIQDAQAEGDQELVEFFSGVLENNLEAAKRARPRAPRRPLPLWRCTPGGPLGLHWPNARTVQTPSGSPQRSEDRP